jgi:hypothetical protein
MFTELNRQYFDVDYAPFRNWAVERGMIKNALAEHGPELFRAAVEETFRTYRPTREYPVLTAGFAIAYRINAVIPKIKAEQKRVQTDEMGPSIDEAEIKAWL